MVLGWYHNMKGLDLNPQVGQGLFCVEFTDSHSICLGSLQGRYSSFLPRPNDVYLVNW